ncbi:MAG: hypothetical protein EAZ08_09215 [Cytophagales bacterium]|nr:MAG: hypothetical protein EAZ08_09215 [Cytophagales bacterium]
MRKPVLIFILLLLLHDFAFSGTRQLSSKPPSAPSPLKQELSQISLADFDADPFGYEVTTTTLSDKLGKKFRILKEVIKNTHNSRIKDTIFHFSYQTTKLKVYKSQGNEMVFSAQITDNSIALRNQISVGMSREEFWQKFNDLERYKFQQGLIEINGDDEMNSYLLTIQPNLIKVSNMMGTADYTFAFVKDKLSQVNIDVYMD